MTDLVSIIIPVYKNIDFLKKSLNSALGQTYKNIEIIIIDDGNNRNDKKKIIEITKQTKKIIKIFHLRKNKGVSNALNLGILKSKGNYISWLSHDDFFHNKKIELQLNFLKKKNSQICSCDFIEINKIYNKKKFRVLDDNYFNDQIISLILNDSLHGCSLLFSKICFKNFKFNNNLQHIQDYDLWHKLSLKFQIVHLKKKLLFSTKHLLQSSSVRKNQSNIEKIKFYTFLVKKKLLFYDYKNFLYVAKFIYKCLFVYKSISLSLNLLSRFIFYKFYNYYRLYFS